MNPSPSAQSLAHLPVALFAAVMGTAGLSVAWRHAVRPWDAPDPVADVLAWVALGLLGTIGLAYAAKTVRHRDAVRAEWEHPVKRPFSATASVGLLVLAIALLPVAPGLARGLWWAGAVLQAVLTIALVRGWLAGDGRTRLEHVHPGWFIPAVGTIVAPIAGVEFASREVVWGFFAVGIVWWVALLPLVVARLLSEPPLPPRMLPTLAILVAPPAVGATAWVRLGGEWDDPVATVLLGVAVFQAVVLAAQLPALLRAPFGVPAWACTFPLAALAAALLRAGGGDGGSAYAVGGVGGGGADCGVCGWLGLAALAAVTVTVAVVGARTVAALVRGWLLVEH